MHRSVRRFVAWACIAAALLLPLGAQLHALTHALAAAQTTPADGKALHGAGACEACLLFAGATALPPGRSPVTPALVAPAPQVARVLAPPATRPLRAYASRAPPSLG